MVSGPQRTANKSHKLRYTFDGHIIPLLQSKFLYQDHYHAAQIKHPSSNRLIPT
jgi:hypothetical protein